jgi:hypothetical protein
LIAYDPNSFWSTAAPRWLAAIGTVSATLLAVLLALYGDWIRRWRIRPILNLDARAQRPDADKARRWAKVGEVVIRDVGEAYFFRLAITNKGNAAALDVQVFLADVERKTGGRIERVDRFTPMNLKWTNTDKTTRPVLLADMPPVYCDMVHVGDPKSRSISGEDLESVPPNDTVLCLDVEVPTYSRGHLLEPGTYLFHLVLAASNCSPRPFTIEVWSSGRWSETQEEMFDTGFKMRKL